MEENECVGVCVWGGTEWEAALMHAYLRGSSAARRGAAAGGARP